MTATLPLQLKQLRLPTMARRWKALTQQAKEHGWDIAQCLSFLCEEELCAREERRLSRHLVESRLPKGKTLASYDFGHIPHLNKERVMGLASQSLWLKEGGNVLLFGPSGVGKTHLAVAIGTELVHHGHRVLFSRTSSLVQKLQKAKRDLEPSSVLGKLDKYDCLILDDFGYVKKDQLETSALFELICDRYESRSLMITCNQPFGDWDEIFMDKVMAVAAVDRLVHHAIILELNAESYRRKQALDRNKRDDN